MRTDTALQMLSFCALPYIDSTKGSFSIAAFEVWPNTSSNWIAYLGVDLSALMTQYRDRNGRPVKDRASIITHKDRSKVVEREEFRAVVVCLSTAAWILDEKFAADAWLFETWHINPKQNRRIYYQREAKYSLQYNSHKYDRLYPTPYMTTPQKFSLAGYPDGSNGHRVLTFLEQQLTCDAQKSLIGVLYRFHKARFDTPYYTAIGDDLDSLWSGFELLWSLSKTETTSEPPSRGLRKYLSRIAQNRLIRAVFAIAKTKKSRNKAQRLADFILTELEPELQSHLIDRQAFEPGLRIWSEELYNKRNLQSHGNPLPVKDDILPVYNRSIYFTGIIIARGILYLRIFGGGLSEDGMASALFYFHFRDTDPLPLLFIEHPVIAETLRFITKVEKTDEWFVSAGNNVRSEEKYDFEKFAETLRVFSRVDKVTIGYKRDRRLLNGGKKMALVLSEYSKRSKSKKIITERGVDVSVIAVLITQILAKQKQANTPQDDNATFALLEEVAEFCDSNLLHRSYVYNLQKTQLADLQIRPGIELWAWIAAFNRMVKMYRGY